MYGRFFESYFYFPNHLKFRILLALLFIFLSLLSTCLHGHISFTVFVITGIEFKGVLLLKWSDWCKIELDVGTHSLNGVMLLYFLGALC